MKEVFLGKPFTAQSLVRDFPSNEDFVKSEQEKGNGEGWDMGLS